MACYGCKWEYECPDYGIGCDHYRKEKRHETDYNFSGSDSCTDGAADFGGDSSKPRQSATDSFIDGD